PRLVAQGRGGDAAVPRRGVPAGRVLPAVRREPRSVGVGVPARLRARSGLRGRGPGRRSGLSAEGLAVLRAGLDLVADGDVRGDLDLEAGLDGGVLLDVGGGVAADGGLGLDDLERDAGGELDADRDGAVEGDDDGRVLADVAHHLADELLGDRELLE